MHADLCLFHAPLIELSKRPCNAQRTTLSTNRCISLWGDQRGRRAPQAARKRLDRMEIFAPPTPALRHAAAQHCGAFDVRSAQAGPKVRHGYELRGAALHAARVGSVVCYVPLLEHRHVGVAVRRHVIRAPAHRSGGFLDAHWLAL
jgi:hypothetical protein